MKLSMTAACRACSLLLTLALAACGGGGGGGGAGGGGGGGGGGNSGGGSISLSTNTLTFVAEATDSTTPPPQTITATVTGITSGTLYLVITVTGNAVSNVTNVQITGTTTGTAQVYPQGQFSLGAGNFTSVITVKACTTDPNCTGAQLSGSPATINVSYTIKGVRTSQAALNYAIGNGPTNADLVRTFNVTGSESQSYTVSANVPWLTVSPTTGSTAASTAVTATLAGIDAMPSGTYTGTVKLDPQSGSDVNVPVTLVIHRTELNYVAPYVEQANTPGDIIIRGDGFSLVTPTQVKFGTTNAVAYSVVSDTELRAAHPPLAAGTYDIHFVNNEGIDRTRAQLVVVEPTDTLYTAQEALTYPIAADFPLELIYDAERKAVIVSTQNQSPTVVTIRYFRYAYTSSWGSPASAEINGSVGRLALTTDGRKLIAAQRDNVNGNANLVIERDPVTLATTLTTSQTTNTNPSWQIAVANDGRTIIPASTFGIRTYWELMPAILDAQPVNFQVSEGVAGASGDGNVVIIGGNGLAQYNPTTHQLQQWQGVPFTVTRTLKMNRKGDRMLADITRVLNVNGGLLGNLPAGATGSAIARENLLAFTYDPSAGAHGSLRVFDLNANPSGSNNEYPELQAIPLNYSLGSNTNPALIAVTPDAKTVFVAGNEQVVVVPIP